jgi:tetratricopeptide (TPR) repeat protein
LNDFEGACEDCYHQIQDLVEFDKDGFILLACYTLTLAYIGLNERAKQQFKIMKFEPKDAYLAKYLEGWVFLILKEYQDALECFLKVLKLKTTGSKSYYISSTYALLGKTYHHLGNYVDAKRNLIEALRRIPKHPEWELWYNKLIQRERTKSQTTKQHSPVELVPRVPSPPGKQIIYSKQSMPPIYWADEKSTSDTFTMVGIEYYDEKTQLLQHLNDEKSSTIYYNLDPPIPQTSNIDYSDDNTTSNSFQRSTNCT